VRQGWFTEPSNLAPATTTSSYPQPAQEGVFSPTKTGKTPLPVIANWFDKLESSLSKETALNDESKIVTDIKHEKASSENVDEKVIVGTCENETKDMLNEMFDNLVSEHRTIEILESSGETETMKRKKCEKVKSLISDDIDKCSVKSDLTIIEKEDVSVLKDDIGQSNSSHSPMEIRKKFQDASTFEKNVTKITDMEFSEEFKEGIKEKIRESKESFLKQVATDSTKMDSQQKVNDIDSSKSHETIFISEDVVTEKFEKKEDNPKDENSALTKKEEIILRDTSNAFLTLHSPMEIRKKFQDASSFEKNFTKITDVELSEEFKEGIKGKVRDSKESFLKQVSTDATKVDSQQRINKIDSIKSPGAISTSEAVVTEKLEKKEDNPTDENPALVKKEEIILEDTNSAQSSYQQEKQARIIELLQVANRASLANNETEAGNRGLQIRKERNKELAELVHRTIEVEPNIEDKAKAIKDERNQELSLLMNRKQDTAVECPEDKTAAMKEARRKELEELVNRKVEFDWTCNTKEKTIKEERAKELYEIANRKSLENQPESTDLCMDQKLRQERAEELKQISEMRSKSSFEMDDIDENSHLLKPNGADLLAEKSDLRGSVRNTAAVWKEREKSGSQNTVPNLDKDVPTRRIGSLFRNDPDYWKLSEPEEPDLPAPPTDLSENNLTVTNPPPPPRQSSRGKMEEYSRDSGWSAPWRST